MKCQRKKAERNKVNKMNQRFKVYRFQAENRHTYTNSDSNNGLIFSSDARVPYETKMSVSQPHKKCKYFGKLRWNKFKTVKERTAKLYRQLF